MIFIVHKNIIGLICKVIMLANLMPKLKYLVFSNVITKFVSMK